MDLSGYLQRQDYMESLNIGYSGSSTATVSTGRIYTTSNGTYVYDEAGPFPTGIFIGTSNEYNKINKKKLLLLK